jgi:hypothetical protein
MELGSGTAACPSPSSWSSWWWWPAQQLVAAGDGEPYCAVIFLVVFCNLCLDNNHPRRFFNRVTLGNGETIFGKYNMFFYVHNTSKW